MAPPYSSYQSAYATCVMTSTYLGGRGSPYPQYYEQAEEQKIEIKVVESDGPYEIMSVVDKNFLRIQNPWTGVVEYVEFDFQVISLRSVVERLGRQWDLRRVEYVEFQAMLSLEACILTKAEGGDLTDEAEKAWQKYLKVKELALKPGTEGEGKVAIKKALKLAADLAL